MPDEHRHMLYKSIYLATGRTSSCIRSGRGLCSLQNVACPCVGPSSDRRALVIGLGRRQNLLLRILIRPCGMSLHFQGCTRVSGLLLQSLEELSDPATKYLVNCKQCFSAGNVSAHWHQVNSVQLTYRQGLLCKRSRNLLLSAPMDAWRHW